MMMEMKNVLVAAAHPDDEVLGVGGTIPLLKEAGCRVTVVVVTDGSSSQYAGDEAVAKRKEEQLRAANGILGTDEVIAWTFPDMRLDEVAHIELNRSFERLIGDRRFDTVFMHHHGDMNLDHRLVYQSLMVASRGAPGQPVRRIFSYYVNSSTEWGTERPENAFVPNLFVSVERTIDRKLAALRAYSDEVRTYPHPRSPDAVEIMAKAFGVQAGCTYAEPFRLVMARERIGGRDLQ
jgi:LmbE family N-acetylglucosaminyl deacetylase